MLKLWMLKIIHRAILKELTLAFILSLIFLNFIMMMEKVLKFSRLLSGVGASVTDMLAIILYLQPQLMTITIPMSLLLSILLTYGRINADNELAILKTGGMSFADICRPVFALGIFCFVAGLAISFSLGPSSAVKMRDYLSNVLIKRAPMAVEAGVFNTSFKDIVMLVRDKPAPEEMKGIFIYDDRNKKEPKVLVAKEGRIHTDREFNLSLYIKDGYIHIARPDGATEISFKGYNLALNVARQGLSRRNVEMTPAELLKEAKKEKKGERVALLLEFHRRLSLPSLCLLLMFLGPPLSLLSGKSGRLGGLTIGLGVFTVFYIMLMYGENMVRAGDIPHFAGAWAPVAITGIASLWAFRKAGLR